MLLPSLNRKSKVKRMKANGVFCSEKESDTEDCVRGCSTGRERERERAVEVGRVGSGSRTTSEMTRKGVEESDTDVAVPRCLAKAENRFTPGAATQSSHLNDGFTFTI